MPNTMCMLCLSRSLRCVICSCLFVRVHSLAIFPGTGKQVSRFALQCSVRLERDG